MKVCVIGAGVIGCATAYELARQGHDVNLLDAAQAPGLGTSYANGAQLSYSYVEPFASPATLRALPKLLLSRGSAVRFYPRWDWRQWVWGLQFLRACSARQSLRGTAQLLQLAQASRAALAQWMRRRPGLSALRKTASWCCAPRHRRCASRSARWPCRPPWAAGRRC